MTPLTSPTGHRSCLSSFFLSSLPPLLFLCCGLTLAPSGVDATPADLQASLRFGNTFAYRMESFEYDRTTYYESGTFYYGLTTLVYRGKDLTILTEEDNIFATRLLQSYSETVETLPNAPVAMDGVFPSDLTLGRSTPAYEYAPKAFLSASFVNGCEYPMRLCCTGYWVDDSILPNQPLASVPTSHIFWNGTHAVNGFYTNFTDAYLASVDCSVDGIGESIVVAMDQNGEWRMVSVYSSNALREINLTKYLGLSPTESGISVREKQLREQAAAAAPFFGADPEATLADTLSKIPATDDSSGGGRGDGDGDGGGEMVHTTPAAQLFNFLTAVPAVVVPVVLLVLLLVLLTALYGIDYAPRRSRLAAFRELIPEVAGADGRSDGEATRKEKNRRRRKAKEQATPQHHADSTQRGGGGGGGAYLADSDESSVGSQNSRTPSPSLRALTPAPKKLSPSPISTLTSTASPTPQRQQQQPSRSPSSLAASGYVAAAQPMQPAPFSPVPSPPSAAAAAQLSRVNSTGSLHQYQQQQQQHAFPAHPSLTHTRSGGGSGSFAVSPAMTPMINNNTHTHSPGTPHTVQGPRRISPSQRSFTSPPQLPQQYQHHQPQQTPRQQQQQQQQQPTVFGRTASFGGMAGSGGSCASSDVSLNSVSSTRTFHNTPQVQRQAQQPQQQQQPSPSSESPRSILVKESSFRRTKQTPDSVNTSATTATPVARSASSPKQLSSAPSQPAPAQRGDEGNTAAPVRKASVSRENPLKNRDSFRIDF